MGDEAEYLMNQQTDELVERYMNKDRKNTHLCYVRRLEEKVGNQKVTINSLLTKIKMLEAELIVLKSTSRNLTL